MPTVNPLVEKVEVAVVDKEKAPVEALMEPSFIYIEPVPVLRVPCTQRLFWIVKVFLSFQKLELGISFLTLKSFFELPNQHHYP